MERGYWLDWAQPVDMFPWTEHVECVASLVRKEALDDYMVRAVYARLKERYDLALTTAFAVSDGFTDDFPLLCGEARGLKFYLYDYFGEYVFSWQVPGQQYNDHTHPQNLEEAEELVVLFMEGKL